MPDYTDCRNKPWKRQMTSKSIHKDPWDAFTEPMLIALLLTKRVLKCVLLSNSKQITINCTDQQLTDKKAYQGSPRYPRKSSSVFYSWCDCWYEWDCDTFRSRWWGSRHTPASLSTCPHASSCPSHSTSQIPNATIGGGQGISETWTNLMNH